MSEAGTHVGIARIRAGSVAGGRRPVVDEANVRAALADVPDPELPMLSVVDLGIVHRVTVAAVDGPIRVEILPTVVGCPALELIKASIADRLAAFGRPVEVISTFEVPWTSDRITAEGRRALAAAGIAPPGARARTGCASGRGRWPRHRRRGAGPGGRPRWRAGRCPPPSSPPR